MIDEFNNLGRISFTDAIDHVLVPALESRYGIVSIHGVSEMDDEHGAYKEYLLTVKKGQYGASTKFKLKSDDVDNNENDIILLQHPSQEYVPYSTKTKKDVASFVGKLLARLDTGIKSAGQRAKSKATAAPK